ncbi:MAG: penicillin acylase family protein, partial [Chitinophagaceae bacterium]
LPGKLMYKYGIDTMFMLPANDFPEMKEVITDFTSWDRSATRNSKGAAIFIITYYYIVGKALGLPRKITKEEAVETYRYVHEYMMKHFGKTGLVLGDVLKLVRGDDERPAWGFPDVLSPSFSSPYKNGMRKVTGGDAYICFVRYPKDGSLPLIESVNTFGASMDPASPHFKDQMTMFQHQQLKRMTLDKKEVLQKALRVYNPVK